MTTVTMPQSGWLTRRVSEKHKLCLYVFTAIVVMHWAEHLVQAFQIYALGWPLPQANGVLGLWAPWLVTTELMHYGYAAVMLFGLWVLRTGFTARGRQWWMLSFALQFWHHIEHLLLFAQALTGQNLGGGPVRSSILQFFVPRVELHLFYNTIVTIPMVIAILVQRRQDRTSTVEVK